MKYEITPREELYSRISKLQKSLQKSDINAAIISENCNLFYFSGMIQRSFLFIPAQGEPVLTVNGNLQRAREESRLKHVVPLQSLRYLDNVLTDFDLSVNGRVGLEFDVLPTSYYFNMQRDFKNAEFVDISESVRRLRMLKSSWELERIRRACKMTDDVMLEALRNIRVGMTELDVDAMLVAYSRRRGHQGQFRSHAYNQAIHYAHILFGRASALSTYVKGPLGGMGTTPSYPIGAGFNVITENQPLIIDFGVGLGGYISDMTRTFVIGKLPSELQRAYNLSQEIKYFMEAWIKPGKYCSELYEEILRMVKKHGLSRHFMGYGDNRVSFVGHGIGMELDEYPIISSNEDTFEKGMVFAFEPKFAFPYKGAVGLEDDYAVTDSGVERLTNYDDSIQVIQSGINPR